MLAIRFFRTGKKNQPFFRIVVTKKTNPPKGGRFLEILGFYNPLKKERNLKTERIKYWLSVGAKPSASVFNLLVEEKIIEGKKIDVHKKPKEKEEETSSEEVVSGKEAVATENATDKDVAAKESPEKKENKESPEEKENLEEKQNLETTKITEQKT